MKDRGKKARRKRAEGAVERELPAALVKCVREFAKHMEDRVIPQIVADIRRRQARAAASRRAGRPLYWRKIQRAVRGKVTRAAARAAAGDAE